MWVVPASAKQSTKAATLKAAIRRRHRLLLHCMIDTSNHKSTVFVNFVLCAWYLVLCRRLQSTKYQAQSSNYRVVFTLRFLLALLQNFPRLHRPENQVELVEINSDVACEPDQLLLDFEILRSRRRWPG